MMIAESSSVKLACRFSGWTSIAGKMFAWKLVATNAHINDVKTLLVRVLDPRPFMCECAQLAITIPFTEGPLVLPASY